MSQTDFSKIIHLGITGRTNKDWQSKLEEINQFKIKEAAVFLECFKKPQRDNLCRMLLKSSIEEVPLVHLRNDCEKEEIGFFLDNFGTKYFNIHEDTFDLIDRWPGYWGNLYLEMNYDNEIAKNVKVRQIGGFCVDLAHFKSAIARGSEEAYYVFLRKNKVRFACNHLNGFDPKRNKDKHTITNLKDFDYLTTLPKYVFGKVIALEVKNSIQEQMKFKEYLSGLLNDYFLEN